MAAADKVVYSTTLSEPRSAGTRIERAFDPDAVRRLKDDVAGDLTVAGPDLAAHALRAGLVDVVEPIVVPGVVVVALRYRLRGTQVAKGRGSAAFRGDASSPDGDLTTCAASRVRHAAATIRTMSFAGRLS